MFLPKEIIEREIVKNLKFKDLMSLSVAIKNRNIIKGKYATLKPRISLKPNS